MLPHHCRLLQSFMCVLVQQCCHFHNKQPPPEGKHNLFSAQTWQTFSTRCLLLTLPVKLLPLRKNRKVSGSAILRLWRWRLCLEAAIPIIMTTIKSVLLLSQKGHKPPGRCCGFSWNGKWCKIHVACWLYDTNSFDCIKNKAFFFCFYFRRLCIPSF